MSLLPYSQECMSFVSTLDAGPICETHTVSPSSCVESTRSKNAKDSLCMRSVSLGDRRCRLLPAHILIST